MTHSHRGQTHRRRKQLRRLISFLEEQPVNYLPSRISIKESKFHNAAGDEEEDWRNWRNRFGDGHRGPRLIALGDELEDYDTYFKQLFCVAAYDLANSILTSLENIGVLFGENLSI